MTSQTTVTNHGELPFMKLETCTLFLHVAYHLPQPSAKIIWMGGILNIPTLCDMSPHTNEFYGPLICTHLYWSCPNFIWILQIFLKCVFVLLSHLDYTFKLTTNWHVAIVLSYWKSDRNIISNNFLPLQCFCVTHYVQLLTRLSYQHQYILCTATRPRPVLVALPCYSMVHNIFVQKNFYYVHRIHVGCPQ
jgi:hypothetical protein